jgi:hypothetical protein
MRASDAVARALRSRGNLLFLLAVIATSVVLSSPFPLVLAAVVEVLVLPAVVHARAARRDISRK